MRLEPDDRCSLTIPEIDGLKLRMRQVDINGSEIDRLELDKAAAATGAQQELRLSTLDSPKCSPDAHEVESQYDQVPNMRRHRCYL
ncbi:MAG: hypothetical protein IPM23_06545 [Candidatus Melainabacteria bacterium]|nr:hypothetical protein [Candidatus Melainabacteria bacterium]